MMKDQDFYYLSAYAHVGMIEAAYRIPRRHDQAMALWHMAQGKLTLCRYWEFERITGIKGHDLSFPDSEAARKFIRALLAEEGLTLKDIRVLVGTPDIIPERTVTPGTPDNAGNYHSLCHLFSGLLMDTERFHREKILTLALDGGPDTVLDPESWNRPHYWAVYSDQGRMRLRPVCSPAIYWALLRRRTGLQEGTLMALGSATDCTLTQPVPAAPAIRSLHDRYLADDWLDKVILIVSALSAEDENQKFRGADARFSFRDNQISMLVKIVNAASLKMVGDTVTDLLDAFAINPAETVLSVTGGYALNCPNNTRLIRRYGFKAFQAPPAVNDSGIALGMGLQYALTRFPEFRFRFGPAYHGRRVAPDFAYPGEASGPEDVVKDLLRGPVVWFDGNAEIGPRALGHRSLLADPGTLESRDRLNVIKQREWWRPVAPIVDIAQARNWFDITGDSPFMLQAVPVRPDAKNRIPAVCHLDGSARIQTLSATENPRLHAVLMAFAARTGVPVLCNTSLNDKGEPIIDTIPRALEFARQKGIEVAYINGRRICISQLPADAVFQQGFPLKHCFEPPALTEDWMRQHNPHGMTREELLLYFSDPRLARYDLTNLQHVGKLRRQFRANMHRRGVAASVRMYAEGPI